MLSEERKLVKEDFEDFFQDRLSVYVEQKINLYNFTRKEISKEQRDGWIKKIVDVLLDNNITKSGEHRLSEWEKGWAENFEALNKVDFIEAIKPKYFGKYPVVRLGGEFYEPTSKDFERNSLSLIQDWLFDSYLRDVPAIYEFGCGTGHNLLKAREANSKAELYGLDWATSSQKIIDLLSEKGFVQNIFGKRFDFFNPDLAFKIKPGGGVYTVAALEQVGDRFKPFVDYLLDAKPGVCIHTEPIGELLDENKLLDYLSLRYFQKRNYLNGFLDYLRKLEQEGKVEILKAQKTNIGSLFIEGYSVVVWRPK